MRAVALLAVFALLVLFIRSWLRLKSLKPPAGESKSADSEAMVRCAQCGVHVPEKIALKSGEKYYCCDEHRRSSGH